LEKDSLHFCIALRELQSLFGRSLVIEADEAVSSRGMVGIQRDFETLNFSDSFKFLLKIGMFEILWNILDKDTVGVELFLVASEQ